MFRKTVLVSIVVALAVITQCKSDENVLPLVTGGTATVIGEAPSVVSIRVPIEVGSDDERYCTGTIINANHILTAASCTHNGTNFLINPFWFRIIAGDLNILLPTYQRFTTRASHIYTHPNYNNLPQIPLNNIAVMRTIDPFPFPHNTIDFAVRNTRPLPVAHQCRFIGWGSLVANGPIQAFQSSVAAPILAAGNCAGNTIQSNMICAGVLTVTAPPSGVCTGNLGGGLFCNVDNWWELTGVLSFGTGCGAINQPGIYMAVRDFNVWINQQLTRTDATNPGIRVVPLP